MKLVFSRQFFLKYSNFLKIRPVGGELFHADRRTNGRIDRHDEVNSLFRNFANVPRNSEALVVASNDIRLDITNDKT
jgi:hypothetical protein